MSSEPKPLPMTAGLVATAVVAAAGAYGDDPVAALSSTAGKPRRAATAAADALQVHTGQPYRAVCAMLQVHPTSFAQARRQQSVGFVAASSAARAALAEISPPWAPPPTPAPVPPEPAPTKLKAVPSVPRPLTVVAAAVTLPPAPVSAGPALKAAMAEAGGPAPVAKPKPSRPARASYAKAQSIRLQPVTGRKKRYAARFLRAGWDIEEVAYLFDVSADALAVALRGVAA